MRALFVHNNFPAQFRDLAPALAAEPGNDVVFATQEPLRTLPGVRKVAWQTARRGKQIHPYLRVLGDAVAEGQGALRMAAALRRDGFVPDVVIGHSGFGPTLFLREAFPEAKFIGYFDWYHKARGTNGDFFPDRPINIDGACRYHLMNAPSWLDLLQCDHGIVTTEWQLEQFPDAFRGKLSLLHDGIDTEHFRPQAGQRFAIPGLDLSGVHELVTYATRGLEPYRGFPQFLAAVQILLRERPRTHVVIAGDERHFYSWSPPGGTTWKQHVLAKLDLDERRVHFTGQLEPPHMLKLLQASDVHVYLTAPFIPSWSLFEAMATGCLVVASATPPVREVMTDGETGLLVNFFDHEALAARVAWALDHRDDCQPLRRAARQTVVERVDLRRILPRQRKLIDDVLAGRPPNEVEASVAGRSERGPGA